MLTFFAALHHKWSNFPSFQLSVSAIIDDRAIIGSDSQRVNDRDMKKITITWIPQIYNEHAHLLCSFTP
jgi:hypothetical protein